jgi:hypothetical protein
VAGWISQSQEHSDCFLLHQGDCSQRIFSWQAKHSIPHTTVTFVRDCVKMYEDFVSNFGDKRTGCCITTTHRLPLPLSPGIFWPKSSWTLFPHSPYFSVFPIEDKTERPAILIQFRRWSWTPSHDCNDYNKHVVLCTSVVILVKY